MGLFTKKTKETEVKNAPTISEAMKSKKVVTPEKQENVNTPSFEKYKNVDWSRISKDKVFQVMADVMNENKRLTQENKRLSNEIEHNYKTQKASNQVDVKKYLEEIAQRIAPELINEINDGKKFKEIEMQEYIINFVLAEKKRYLDKILSLTEKEKMQKELLSELQQQVYGFVEKRNQEKAEQEEQTVFTEEDFKNMTANSTPTEENVPVEKEEKQSNIILKAISLEKARVVFNEADSLAVIKAIGVKGLSEFPEIAKYVKENDGVSENRLETVVNNLEKESIVEIVRIYTFQRNSGLRLIKLNEEIGYKLYKETFKKEPVKSEMRIIRAENDNYEHGYNIKDTCEVLKQNYGYENVSMDRKQNTIHISNLNTWIPDIIGINPISKKKEYFEVEMGNHNEANFNFKLDKALIITNELKIIAPNKMTANKLLEKVKAWYNSKKNHPNIVIKVYTYVEFKRKEEGRMYPSVLQDKNILEEAMEIEKTKIIEKNSAALEQKKNLKPQKNNKNQPTEPQEAVKTTNEVVDEV